jgi:hypothetical protein
MGRSESHLAIASLSQSGRLARDAQVKISVRKSRQRPGEPALEERTIPILSGWFVCSVKRVAMGLTDMLASSAKLK